METARAKDARAVILPAFDTTTLSDAVKRFLDKGGCSLLLGESRQEYLERRMSASRRSAENPGTFIQVTQAAAKFTSHLLVAVDMEIGGICRLHDLTPRFPDGSELAGCATDGFEQNAAAVAAAAKGLGVNCFLGPILDVVTGPNPWLSGRTWSTDPNEIARLSSAYIRGVQSAGVAAAAKHFPGFHHIDLDPAIESAAMVTDGADAFEPGFIPFTHAIQNGVEIVMAGPAIVRAFDTEKPASISPKVIGMLRKEFGFKGVILSDDLDSRATLRKRPIEEVAVASLTAGTDFLLLAAENDQLERVAQALVSAVEKGMLAEKRLSEAAAGVRALARRYSDG